MRIHVSGSEDENVAGLAAAVAEWLKRTLHVATVSYGDEDGDQEIDDAEDE